VKKPYDFNVINLQQWVIRTPETRLPARAGHTGVRALRIVVRRRATVAFPA
jgi:hypothetical protein